MSAKANPVRIGVFVVGAIALVVAGLLAFGSRGLFTEHPRYIAFFEGSVAGLNVGAPVGVAHLLYHSSERSASGTIRSLSAFSPAGLRGSNCRAIVAFCLTRSGRSMPTTATSTGRDHT